MIKYINFCSQALLDSFVDGADSTYGCLMCESRIVCATKNWWALHSDEIQLLADFISADQACNLRDVPVFLPVKSPTVNNEFLN
jgi:DNA topoisomerase 2-associated protein PAT1